MKPIDISKWRPAKYFDNNIVCDGYDPVDYNNLTVMDYDPNTLNYVFEKPKP